jgi:hypothetical protein
VTNTDSPSDTSPRLWPTRGTLTTMPLRRRFSPPRRTRRCTWPGRMRRSTSPEPPRPQPTATDRRLCSPGHRTAPHPEDILREAHVIRKLDIGQAHANMRGVIYQSLAVDQPLVRVGHVRRLSTSVRDAPRPRTRGRWPLMCRLRPLIQLGPTGTRRSQGQHRFSTRLGNDRNNLF